MPPSIIPSFCQLLHHCFLLPFFFSYLLIFLFAFFVYLLCLSFPVPTCLCLPVCSLLLASYWFFVPLCFPTRFLLFFSFFPSSYVRSKCFFNSYLLYYTDYLCLFLPTRFLRVCSVTFLFHFPSSSLVVTLVLFRGFYCFN